MIRFRQWSRKGYAIFASLGKHVTIGHVCKSIAEASLTKTGWLDKPCLNRKNKTDEKLAAEMLAQWTANNQTKES